MSRTPLNVALVGSSGHALRVAAPVLRQSPGVTLLGAAGSRPGRGAELARRVGLSRSYATLDELLADPDVDAVWICSPNHLHADQIVQCARAGKHILAEKPLATRREDAQRAAAAARAGGVTLRIGYQHRFRPAHRRLRQLLEDGAVGTIGVMRIHRLWPWPYYSDQDPSGPPDWRQSLTQSGGWVINDLGAHLVDLMHWLTGLPLECVGAALAAQRFEVATEDTAALLVRLGRGGIGVVETSAANRSPGSRIEVYGDQGWIQAEDTLSGAGVVRLSTGGELRFPAVEPLEPYVMEVADFLGAIRGEPSIGATADDGVAAVAVLEDAYARGVPLRD